MNGPIAFLEKSYDEAVELLAETRAYAIKNLDAFPANQIPIERLRMQGEMMRITARLTQVMSWVLMHRALQGGELTESEIGIFRFSAGARELGASSDMENDEALPEGLRELLARSRSLYERIERLNGRINMAPESSEDGAPRVYQ